MGGGLVRAGSCGCICMCCSDEMLSETVIASVFSRQIGGRVPVGRDNSLSIYLSIFLKDLKLFSVLLWEKVEVVTFL